MTVSLPDMATRLFASTHRLLVLQLADEFFPESAPLILLCALPDAVAGKLAAHRPESRVRVDLRVAVEQLVELRPEPVDPGGALLGLRRFEVGGVL